MCKPLGLAEKPRGHERYLDERCVTPAYAALLLAPVSSPLLLGKPWTLGYFGFKAVVKIDSGDFGTANIDGRGLKVAFSEMSSLLTNTVTTPYD